MVTFILGIAFAFAVMGYVRYTWRSTAPQARKPSGKSTSSVMVHCAAPSMAMVKGSTRMHSWIDV